MVITVMTVIILRYLNKNVSRQSGNIIYTQIIPKLNVQQIPTTYPRDGEAKHLRRRKTGRQSVYKHYPSNN